MEIQEQFVLHFLPRELILSIINFAREREYICQGGIDDLEDDGIECDNLKQLLKENKGPGYYYPGRNLYATCSSFRWLSELEYVCIESGEFYYNIVSRNINGLAHGMCYNGTVYTGILGYSLYNYNNLIKGNILSNDSYYFHRYINDNEYHEEEDCSRWGGNCDKDCNNCKQLDIIQQQIFTKDPELEKIFKTNYDEWIVIARIPVKSDIISDLHYSCDNLKPFS